jgi:type II secretory pathway component PulF
MGTFRYTGRKSDGSVVSGTIQSETSSEAASIIAARAITPIEIEAIIKKVSRFSSTFRRLLSYVRLDRRDFRLFSLKMSVLLKAGISIEKAIEELAKSSKNLVLKLTLRDIEHKLKSGYDLVASFSGYPYVFSSLYIAFLKQSENNGRAYQVFERLAENINLQNEIRKKLLSPLLPYLFTIAVIILVTTLLSQQALPLFHKMLYEKNLSLPSYTMMLIHFMELLNDWHYWLTAIVAVVMAVFLLRKNQSIRITMDKLFIKIPMVGRLVREYAVGEFLRSLSLAIQNGLTVQDSIKVSSVVLKNGYLRQQINLVMKDIDAGAPVWTALERSQLFDNLEVQMLRLGEQANDIELSVTSMISLNEEAFSHELVMASETLRLLLLFALSMIVILVAFGFYFGLWTISTSGAMYR